MARALGLAGALLLLGGCQLPAGGDASAAGRDDCLIAGSSGWRAWVDAMPGSERTPRLNVTGKVTVPTGGWRVALERGPVQEIDPPVQQLILRAVPPREGATQAVVQHEVHASFKALPNYGGVTIRCGEQVLAQISEVERVW